MPTEVLEQKSAGQRVNGKPGSVTVNLDMLIKDFYP